MADFWIGFITGIVSSLAVGLIANLSFGFVDRTDKEHLPTGADLFQIERIAENRRRDGRPDNPLLRRPS